MTTQKSYPVFDCDAHITEQPQIWGHLSEKERETVKPWYWPEGSQLIINGEKVTGGIWNNYPGRVSLVEVAGPGVDRATIRKLRHMAPLTPEQSEYVNHKGARNPKARLVDLDLQGIDQVVVIPIQMFNQFLFVENHYAAALVARAYNDWVHAWCSTRPDRLFPAAALPVQNPLFAAEEVRRVAKMGFRVALLRPVDIQGAYPNQASYEPLWNAFEETGIACGMHSLTSGVGVQGLDSSHRQWSPGIFQERVLDGRQMQSEGSKSQTIGFIHEAMTWMCNVLLSGFLERHPGVTMAIMESNAGWLPMLLEECDKAVQLYKSERRLPISRPPSQSFMDHCFIAFERDEKLVYLQHALFENIGIWSSDVYHADGADAWSAIRAMDKLGVSQEVQAKLMGGNARRMYRIEPTLCTTIEPESYPRPDWYPKAEEIELEYAPLAARR